MGRACRLLAGICGWGPYQLGSEILDETWCDKHRACNACSEALDESLPSTACACKMIQSMAAVRWVVSASGNTVQDLITTATDERAAALERDMLWLNMLSLAQIQLDQ